MQNEFVLNAIFLIDYNIKPRDLIDLITKSDLTKFIKDYGLRQREDDILNILEHYKVLKTFTWRTLKMWHNEIKSTEKKRNFNKRK